MISNIRNTNNNQNLGFKGKIPPELMSKVNIMLGQNLCWNKMGVNQVIPKRFVAEDKFVKAFKDGNKIIFIAEDRKNNSNVLIRIKKCLFSKDFKIASKGKITLPQDSTNKKRYYLINIKDTTTMVKDILTKIEIPK